MVREYRLWTIGEARPHTGQRASGAEDLKRMLKRRRSTAKCSSPSPFGMSSGAAAACTPFSNGPPGG